MYELFDNFNYDTLVDVRNGGWALRGSTYGTTGERMNSRSDWLGVSPQGDHINLRIRPDADNPGKHLVGHITLGVLPFVYGWMEADINFQRPKGAHGAFWHQSGYVDGCSELDIVEFFGERKDATPDIQTQKVQHTVHTGPLTADGKTNQNARFTWTDGHPATTEIPSFDGNGRFGPNRTWWGNTHTYAVEWQPTGYNFFVDGVRVGRTVLPSTAYSAPAASKQGWMIFSLLSNDGPERDDLLEYIRNGGSYDDYQMEIHRLQVKSAA